MFKFQLVLLGPNLGDQAASSSGLLLQAACIVCNVSHLLYEGRARAMNDGGYNPPAKTTVEQQTVSCYPVEEITGEAKVMQNGDSKETILQNIKQSAHLRATYQTEEMVAVTEVS